ncbi:MAG: sigma-70 family RNA polymerase sigma factor [Anaerolineae bacterium]|nr:sigma-70 family RNA polymerase sigma factor [Anaerolineae bacterium]
MMSQRNLDALIQQARQGDTRAVSALYREFSPAIFRYIMYRVPAEADAEDLTAEVFLRMVEALPEYQPTGAPFEAWLYRIAAARVADFHRRRSRREVGPLVDELADEAPQPEERLETSAEMDTLRAALARLPEDQQTLLLLRFVENKSHREVAEILGRSESAVKTAQYRALTRLAKLLGEPTKTRHYLRGTHD